MKIFIACILIILTLPQSIFSQQNCYWVKFKDKNNNPFSLDRPQEFLSQLSINRRIQQGIPLDSTDLPLTPSYVDSVSAYSTMLVNRLKWDNLVVVMVDSPANLNIIKSFPFVDSVNAIEFIPSRSVPPADTIETIYPVNQDITYPNPTYGAAYRQIEMMNGDLLHEMGYRGRGIIISMMDNGCIYANTLPAFDSVMPRVLMTWNFVYNQAYVFNDGGHGTETFGCIAGNLPGRYLGTAPDASFFLYQVQTNTEEWIGEEYSWAEAAEMADSGGSQIFSTSLAYTVFDGDSGNHTYADLNGDKTVITHAGNQAFSKGILVFNAAGNYATTNSPLTSWYYIGAPADGDSILAIGAVNPEEVIASFSSRGPNSAGVIKPDLCAVGDTAWVLTIAGGVAYSFGTSFACPVMAGCAACLWQAFPEKTARQIKEAIVASADRYLNPNNTYGYGIPDFYKAYLYLATDYDTSILHVNKDVLVYPNPFTNSLNVSIYNTSPQTHTVQLFNMLGQEVYTNSFFVRDSTFSITTIQGMGGLASGEYFLRFDGNRNTVQTILKL